jgi:hypothetical protein
MTRFRIHGISETLAADVRRTMRAPGYGHPAFREIAHGTGPCRLCLRTFHVGDDERILFTYQPFRDPGSLPAPGPVFIHAEGCPRYDATELPPDFRSVPMVYEAYRRGGRLLAQERPDSAAADAHLSDLFARTGADYVHIRNGEAGCFMAVVEPVRAAATA